MASVFRRTYNETLPDGTKKKYRGKVYHIKYRDGAGCVRVVKGYTDKEASKQLGARLERDAARGAEGMVNPFSDSLKRPAKDHIADHVADLEATGRDAMYCYNVEHRLLRLFAACEWGTLAAVDCNAFIQWRTQQRAKAAARTLNQYLETARAFLKWCKRHKRIPFNPLEDVELIDTRGLEKRKRRALTVDELRALVAAAPDRALCYRTVVCTGMRRAEVEALRWADVHLDADPAYVTLRIETAKGKRQNDQPLRADVAADLAKARPAGAGPADLVFPSVPDMETFRADLTAAGIAYMDTDKRQADFHALRTTMNTMLANSGVAPRTAMELMRHTDIKLTMRAYTDPRLLDNLGAIESLPDLSTRKARKGKAAG